MRKLILTMILMSLITPVMADEVNMTPRNTYSGFYNQTARPMYPQLRKPLSATDILQDENEDSMNSKPAKEYKSSTGRQAPMTYDKFPQNYDSSNSIMLMQGGMQNIQNMYMGL